ncbi:MAG: RagB/SusD family nutrient uptake outer membrane protein [Bacteroidales bacterium]|nr:RagB/SusD family nutrient uptake outer membrane protein [Bacteroidales bacterium]
MKKFIKYIVTAMVLVLVCASCEKFLDRPAEDSYTTANYYQNDTQVEQSVNYLYNSPWYDIIRFYIYGSETMCGNVFQDNNAYATLTVNGTDADLKNMSYSLWAVNAQCNTVINNILNSTGTASQAVKDKAMGEALAWKAMAYFLLVRTFGDVPIIHNNTEVIKEATYNQQYKILKTDVYEYIIMTLEAAMELLPKDPNIGKYNRIDYYAAEGLLAKVYLTKAGVSGSLDRGDLEKARDYALDVIKNSGRSLTPNYSDIFRLQPSLFQQTGENLFSWQWVSGSGIWTAQNSIQSDVGPLGIDEYGATWGDWKGPSIDLQDAFGVSADIEPALRVDRDDRRVATIMMFGDFYPQYWQDKGGFDMYRFYFDDTYYPSGLEANGSNHQWCCQSGALYAKHLYGCGSDHSAALGVSADRMCYQLPTHILRLADIYLIYAEACVLTGDDSSALEYVNLVRARAHAAPLKSCTFEDVWKERRLELALEGDRWYDFVRRSYYDVDACIAELKAQRRSYWDGITDVCKNYVVADNGEYVGPGAHSWDSSSIIYNPKNDLADVKASMFTVPFPTEDVVMNPNVGSDVEAIHLDVRETFNYDYILLNR